MSGHDESNEADDVDLPSFMALDGVISAPALALLLEQGAGGIAHHVGTFRKHLVETCAILHWWGLPRPIALAGLYHSVYSTSTFRRTVIGLDQRERVATLIGAEAERLAFLFHRAARDQLWASCASLPEGEVQIPAHEGGHETCTSRELGALAYVEAANLAQQAAREDDHAPDEWLAAFERLQAEGARRTGLATALPAVFRRPLTRAAEAEGLAAYLAFIATHEGGRALTASERAQLRRCHALLPMVFEPLLWLALDERRHRRSGRARRLAALATRQAMATGVLWDKRLTWSNVEAILGRLRA